jgi:hypothetical protein
MIALLRPYLHLTAYHYGRRHMASGATVRSIVMGLESEWMIDAIVKEAYARSYTSWKGDIKDYLKDQRLWNGLFDDFDWDAGGLYTPERARVCIECFGVEIDVRNIDAIREFVADNVQPTLSEYEKSLLVVEEFWAHLNSAERFVLVL